MSIFAELAQAARLTELEEANEQLHGDIRDLEGVIDAFTSDLKDAERELDRLDDKIQKAVADLRFLTEVPLRDLEDSINRIMEELTA